MIPSPPTVTPIPRSRRCLRTAIEDVFDTIGGTDGMVEWITSSTVNKRIFYKDILPKVIPRQFQGEITGAGGGPMRMVVEWAPPALEVLPPSNPPALEIQDAILTIAGDPEVST